MSPDQPLAGASWLAASGVQAIFKVLGPKQVRCVGGCVRNALLGQPVTDVDLATTHTPDAVTGLLEAAGFKVVPTGIAHGTVTAIHKGVAYEITTLRRDVETDGRHAVVAYTTDWAEDAARRDFTMNALYCDAEGRIDDPIGGQADLAARRVRFIGIAADRIAEDALRILRFFRFHAWYGVDQLDDEGLAACAAATDLLANLSAERIWAEMKKLLAAPDPLAGLHPMDETGVLTVLMPAPADLPCLRGALASWPEMAVLGRLAALAPGQAEALALRWKLSRAEARTLQTIQDAAADRATPPHLLAYTHGLIEARAGLAITRPDELADLVGFAVPEFPLRGKDLQAIGIKSGRGLGSLLKELEAWWMARNFAPSKDELVDEARRQVGQKSRS